MLAATVVQLACASQNCIGGGPAPLQLSAESLDFTLAKSFSLLLYTSDAAARFVVVVESQNNSIRSIAGFPQNIAEKAG